MSKTATFCTRLCALVVAALTCAASATPAAAAPPLWKVETATLPAYLVPGGTGQYQLYVTNVSPTPSSGTVTVTDTLPPGVEAVSAGDIASLFVSLRSEFWHCAGTQVVTCVSDATSLPSITRDDWYGRHPDNELKNGSNPGSAPPIGINVTASSSVATTETNAVQVSGGGARSTSTHSAPTQFSSEPPPGGLQNFSLSVLNADGTPDTQAGSHPYEMTTSFTVNSSLSGFPLAGVEGPVQEPKDLELDLPVGLVGNDQVVTQCSRAVFDAGITGTAGSPTCPADSQVGTAIVALGYPNINLDIPVFNLTHGTSVPAEFGFGFEHHRAIIDAGLRTGDGYGLKVDLGDLESGIRLDGSSITLWGEPADPSHNPDRCFTSPSKELHSCGLSTSLPRRPLLTLPSSCGLPLSQTLKVDYWRDPGVFQSYSTSATDDHGNALPLTGCERLDFSPSLTLQPGVSKADSPTGLTVDLHVPQNETPEGLAESDLEGATVAFPAGLAVNPSAADGLVGCSPAQIGLDSGAVPSCPDASKIGTVAIETPLLASPLRGAVYLAEQGNNPFGSLLAIYIEAEEEGGIIVKIAGHVIANASSGQLTAVFDESPPLPFTDLRLELFGGPRAPLVTPAGCGTYSTSTDFVGYDGTLASFASPFSISSGCGGGFAPSFAAGVTGTAQAGAFAPFTLRFARSDEDQLLGGIQIHTPPGLLGVLASVPLCPEPQAAQGTCGPESLIGHTTVGVGAGEEPFYIHAGQVFLTGPYKGAPFGLSIVVPAIAGPFNLGTVAVRASISVDPNTSQLTITSDPLPQIVQGIPILLRSVEVAVDRPDFMFNPTNCEPLAITATLTGSLGASAPVSSPFQASNCAGLAFKPGFHVSTQGHTSKVDGASLDVKLTYPSGSFGTAANIAKVKVDLPKQLPSRLTTLQKACPGSTFDVNPGSCPAASIVGVARASTPVLPGGLAGPAYFVSHGGAKFPELIVVLQGDGVRVDLSGETFISKAGITSSTFATVPDVPVSSFELYLPEGRYSALGANGNLCTSKLAMPTAFTAQNGAVIRQSTKITVTGCAKPKPSTKAKKARTAANARNGRST
ncbi:MAG TPA: hypothetical protein VK655_04885 [Solirubrobacteraceae bacterium]|jgi:uncharacterized repeat protein (TIGR01451 family)|nr:hypothetical protein [Solirubrobacteraceae bacterium]